MSFFSGAVHLIRGRFDRARVRECIPDIVARRESRLGVSPRNRRIRCRKTRWGTCTSEAGRFFLNSELAKKPPPRLKSVVVEEMPYLIERHHNEHFRTIFDRVPCPSSGVVR